MDGETCATDGNGTAPEGTPCAFPFAYGNRTHTACTGAGNGGVPWCATQAGAFQSGATPWGNCVCTLAPTSSPSASPTTPAPTVDWVFVAVASDNQVCRDGKHFGVVGACDLQCCQDACEDRSAPGHECTHVTWFSDGGCRLSQVNETAYSEDLPDGIAYDGCVQRAAGYDGIEEFIYEKTTRAPTGSPTSPTATPTQSPTKSPSGAPTTGVPSTASPTHTPAPTPPTPCTCFNAAGTAEVAPACVFDTAPAGGEAGGGAGGEAGEEPSGSEAANACDA